MGRNEKKYGTIGLMILTVIIIFSVVGIVIAGFRMIKKNEDARLILLRIQNIIRIKRKGRR